MVGRGISVGKATRYGLDGPAIESRWGGGLDFPYPSRPAQGPTQPLIQWVPGFFRVKKRPGRGVKHPHPSRAEIKERVEQYPCSLLGLFYLLLAVLPISPRLITMLHPTTLLLSEAILWHRLTKHWIGKEVK